MFDVANPFGLSVNSRLEATLWRSGLRLTMRSFALQACHRLDLGEDAVTPGPMLSRRSRVPSQGRRASASATAAAQPMRWGRGF